MPNCQDCGKPYTFSAQEIAMDPRPPYRCKGCREMAQSDSRLALLLRPYGGLTGGERKQIADEITALRVRLAELETALATARRDALEEAAAEAFEAWMDGVPASKICDRIRALIAQEEPTT